VLALPSPFINREIAVRIVWQPSTPEIRTDCFVRVFNSGVTALNWLFNLNLTRKSDRCSVNNL